MVVKRKILVIDDEKNNLEIIEGFLRIGQFDDHSILKCDNGEQGYKILKEYAEDIDVIILDRMMPIMSGVDFIKKVRVDKILKRIPIIMQTASTEHVHMIEGFQLGVYHYLVKPYLPAVFNSVVRAAIDFYTASNELHAKINKTDFLYHNISSATFRLNRIHEVDEMSVGLAQLFPDPAKVVLGISEILSNAIEHGSYNISYEEKTKLNLQYKWKEEVERRGKLPENKNKMVIITYSKLNNQIILNVKDQGQGFDFAKYLDFDVDRSTDNHGRGIAFAKSLSFDAIEYVGNGNEVNCIVKL